MKGTVSVVSREPPCKNGNTRSRRIALKPLSDQYVEYFVAFLDRKMFNFINSYMFSWCTYKCESQFCREQQLKNKLDHKLSRMTL